MLFTLFLVCILIGAFWAFLEYIDVAALGVGAILIGIIWVIGLIFNFHGDRKDVITPVINPITKEVIEFRLTRYNPAIMPEWAVGSQYYKPGSAEYKILAEKELKKNP